jgi:uncharacterized membrane-anchored protein YitT (DUF2179 family)
VNNWLQESKNSILIILGVLAAAMGLKGFLFSSRFIDGGVTGISMLLSKTTTLPLSVWLPLINIPFIAVAYQQLGKAFALRSTLAISGLALTLAFVPFPDVTHDLVLTAIFGGLFIGAGIGLAIRGGAVLDGTEIAALLISRRIHILKVGDVILVFNIILFIAALSLLGTEQALYSIVTYAAAAKTLDFVIYGFEEYTALTIFSAKNSLIREKITGDLGRGVTVFKGFGGLSKEDQEILYCVVTRLEVGEVKKIVHAIDKQAFIAIHPLASVEGGFIKRTVRH